MTTLFQVFLVELAQRFLLCMQCLGRDISCEEIPLYDKDLSCNMNRRLKFPRYDFHDYF